MRGSAAGIVCLAGAMMAAGSASAQERVFDEAGEWSILAGMVAGSFGYCVAEREIDGRAVRIWSDGEAWTFGLASEEPGKIGAFDIDDESHPLDQRRDDGITELDLTYASLEAVRNGRLATVILDGEEVELPLNGTAAAALRVQDCLRLEGAAPEGEDDLYAVETLTATETGPMGPGCPARDAAASVVDGVPTELTLRLAGAGDVLQVYWVDPFGRLLPMPVAFGAEAPEVTLDAYAGQSFVVKDLDGACRGEVARAVAGGAIREIQ